MIETRRVEMKKISTIALVSILLSQISLLSFFVMAGEVTPALPLDPAEPVGEPPYEMTRINRTPVRPPTVGFDSLEGWTIDCREGAVAQLSNSKRQHLWDIRQFAKL